MNFYLYRFTKMYSIYIIYMDYYNNIWLDCRNQFGYILSNRSILVLSKFGQFGVLPSRYAIDFSVAVL